jgi:hypothetical protein
MTALTSSPPLPGNRNVSPESTVGEVFVPFTAGLFAVPEDFASARRLRGIIVPSGVKALARISPQFWALTGSAGRAGLFRLRKNAVELGAGTVSTTPALGAPPLLI